jgi:hypothetical protein
LNIDGVWKAAYAPVDVEESEEFDGDRSATLTLREGTIDGYDRYGGIYKGTYKVEAGRFKAKIEVTSEDPEAVTIYESSGVEFPLTVEIDTEYNSTDHVVLKGTLNGSFPIIGQAERFADLIK